MYLYTSVAHERVSTNYAAFLCLEVGRPCGKWREGFLRRSDLFLKESHRLSVCLSIWAWFRNRPQQRSQDSNLAVMPRRGTVMTLTLRRGTMWPSNSHQSQTGVSSVWQTPLWNKLIFHQMKEQTFWVLLCKARQTRVTMLMGQGFSVLSDVNSFFLLYIITVRVFRSFPEWNEAFHSSLLLH
jgi:hypothetical protein